MKRYMAGELTEAEAWVTKLWHTEQQERMCDITLQLHGGARGMNDPVARLWRNARGAGIFGGMNEIMNVIGRSIR